jgi:hypothetical protein
MKQSILSSLKIWLDFFFKKKSENVFQSQFSLLAFILGAILDILIYKMKIFGNRLDDFYKEYGAGFLGGAAFVFSVVISYFIQKNLKRLL